MLVAIVLVTLQGAGLLSPAPRCDLAANGFDASIDQALDRTQGRSLLDQRIGF